MESPELVRLSVPQFESRIKANYKQLQLEKKFSDVTIACEDGQIEAHKGILAGSSEVLNAILKKNDQVYPLIFLTGIKFGDLENILQFIYQGEININQEDLGTFLSVAHDLKVKGVTENTVEDLKQSEHLVDENGIRKKQDTISQIKEDKNIDYHVKIEFEMDDSFSETIYQSNVAVDSKLQEITQLKTNNKIGQSKLKIRDIVKLSGKSSKIHNFSNNRDSISKKSFICILCNTNYSTKENLNIHIFCAHKEILHSCEKCNFQAIERESLQKHMGIHIISEDDFKSCQHCNKVFYHKSSLKQHIATAHNGTRYSCEKCEYEGATFSGLKDHISRLHSELLYSCVKCEYKATKKESLKKHMETHIPISTSIFKCEPCNKVYSCKGGLTTHNAATHGFSYSCDKCDYKAVRKLHLKKHMLIIHNSNYFS